MFLAFLKCALNLEHFEKKDEYCSLVISKIINSERGGYLTLFVNTLTTYDKFSRRNMLNFTQELEAPLPQKQKTFSRLFLASLKIALNLAHFEKKDEYSSLVISKVINAERGGYLKV